MDLFLESTFRSLFLELISNYLQLVKEKKVNPIRLSSDTLKLVSEKDISFPSLPLLVQSGGKTLRSALSISLHFLDITYTKDILIGSKKEDQLSIFGLFELLERSKSANDLVEHFDSHFEKKTFWSKNHVALGDLLLFAFFHNTVSSWNDDEKKKRSSLFRWFKHIQSLTGIKDFLENSGRGLVSIPK